MAQESILVVDDEAAMRTALREVLGRAGFRVVEAADGQAAIEAVEAARPDLVVSDMRMPEPSGLTLLAELRRRQPDLPIIIMTAYGTIEDAVAAMKLGAFDFLTKPFSPADLLHLVRRALQARATIPAAPAAAADGDRRIVTADPAFARTLEIAATVAASAAPVLIQGESGTGKELLARFIHRRSPRQDGPFVPVNCAALPRELLESELFGHERGAFTGAVARKAGKFELAHGGTLLLDEIGEMELGLQAKLLRVLQEYEIDRVGGTRPVPVDIRVVATTNRPLRQIVARGQFREDLYYRLHVVPLVLPPLRERPGDVDLLVDHFLGVLARGRQLTVSPEARAYLRAQRWPGNVRQLESAIARAVLLARGPVLEAADFAVDEFGPDQTAPAAPAAGTSVREMERQLILATLRRTNNNRTRAAQMLGISIRTLRNKLAEYREHGQLTAETTGI